MVVSLNSRLESNKDEEEAGPPQDKLAVRPRPAPPALTKVNHFTTKVIFWPHKSNIESQESRILPQG